MVTRLVAAAMAAVLVGMLLAWASVGAVEAQTVWYTTNPHNPQLIAGPFRQSSDCNGYRGSFPDIGWCWWSYREVTGAVVYHFFNRQVGESIGPFGDYWQCRGAAGAVTGGAWGDCFAGYTQAVGVGANWYFTRAQKTIGPFASNPQCEQYRAGNGGYIQCWNF